MLGLLFRPPMAVISKKFFLFSFVLFYVFCPLTVLAAPLEDLAQNLQIIVRERREALMPALFAFFNKGADEVADELEERKKKKQEEEERKKKELEVELQKKEKERLKLEKEGQLKKEKEKLLKKEIEELAKKEEADRLKKEEEKKILKKTQEEKLKKELEEKLKKEEEERKKLEKEEQLKKEQEEALKKKIEEMKKKEEERLKKEEQLKREEEKRQKELKEKLKKEEEERNRIEQERLKKEKADKRKFEKIELLKQQKEIARKSSKKIEAGKKPEKPEKWGSCFELLGSSTVFIAKDLDAIALEKDGGYGYKYGNLTQLRNLTQALNVLAISEWGYRFEVPVFIGISSTRIQEFLRDVGELDLAKEWNDIRQKFLINNKSAILKNRFYPQGFFEACEKLEQKIKMVFLDSIKKIDNGYSFDFVFTTYGLDDFIKTIADKKAVLMVRSTGKEDTTKLANAGGNESVPNVKPEVKEILEAIDKVVCSYLGRKSLEQRLGAGDESLFDDEVPFTPVLLQEMIGEVNPSELPRCGVMFTEDPETSVSRVAKGKSSGVVIIQGAYGHNEGVVNSLIPVDTYYGLLSGECIEQIYPIIRQKTHRMVPVPGEQRVTLVPNERKSDIIAPVFLPGMVKSLCWLASALEHFYTYPLDVEFVIDKKNGVIYLVQARPIVHSSKLAEPSYLEKIDQIPAKNILKGSAIGAAGGSVRSCSGDELIVMESIGKALNYYLALPDRQKIKGIIVGQMAPSTSHEATTFRGEAKPVIFIKDWQTVFEFTELHEKILLSPQQGVVVGTTGVQEELLSVKKGWASYPAPALISLETAYRGNTWGGGELLIRMLTGKNEEEFKEFWKSEIKESPYALLQMVKVADEKEARLALAKIMVLFNRLIAREGKAELIDEAWKNEIKLLLTFLDRYAMVIKSLLEYGPSHKEKYPQRLCAVRFLENLLFQKNDEGIWNGYSFVTALAGLEKEKKIKKETEIVDPYSRNIIKLVDVAFSDEAKEAVRKFAVDLSKTDDEQLKQESTNLIGNVFKLGILPVWLHTSFISACTNNPNNIAAVIENLKNEYEASKDILNEIAEKKKGLKAFNVGAFGNPKSFKVAWESFEKDIVSYFVSDDLKDKFDSSPSLVKTAYLALMRDFVDTFDTSIKTLTGSTEYSLEDKLNNYRTMLKLYLKVFGVWVQIVPEGAINYNKHVTEDQTKKNEKEYQLYLKYPADVVNKIDLAGNDLLPTKNFNVLLFTPVAGVNISDAIWQRIIPPATLEDAFTTIHQNLICIISVLNKSTDIMNITLPVLLKQADEMMKALKTFYASYNKNSNISLVGMDLSFEGIGLHYNLPLSNHSAQFDLFARRDEQTVELTAHFVGHLYNSWVEIGGLALLLDDPVNFPLVGLNVTENGMFMKFSVSQPLLKAIMEFLQVVVERATGGVWGTWKQLHSPGFKEECSAKYSARVLENLPVGGIVLSPEVTKCFLSGVLNDKKIKLLFAEKLLQMGFSSYLFISDDFLKSAFNAINEYKKTTGVNKELNAEVLDLYARVLVQERDDDFQQRFRRVKFSLPFSFNETVVAAEINKIIDGMWPKTDFIGNFGFSEGEAVCGIGIYNASPKFSRFITTVQVDQLNNEFELAFNFYSMTYLAFGKREDLDHNYPLYLCLALYNKGLLPIDFLLKSSFSLYTRGEPQFQSNLGFKLNFKETGEVEKWGKVVSDIISDTLNSATEDGIKNLAGSFKNQDEARKILNNFYRQVPWIENRTEQILGK